AIRRDLGRLVVRGAKGRAPVMLKKFGPEIWTADGSDVVGMWGFHYQQLPTDWFSGWRAVLAKWDLMLGSEPSVPRKFRAAFIDRRAALERILAWPAEKVLMAHGTPVTEDAQTFIRRAFGWLMA